jgi:spore coat protein U-like protein
VLAHVSAGEHASFLAATDLGGMRVTSILRVGMNPGNLSNAARAASALALAVLAGAASPALAATDAGNVNVSATVGASCVITTAPLDFGNYAPLTTNAAAPLDASGSLVVQCTGGSGSGIGLGDGLNFLATRRLLNGAANYLSYELYRDAGRSLRWGDAVIADRYATGFPFAATGSMTITIYGRVPGGQLVPAGTYTDTVTATVYF